MKAGGCLYGENAEQIVGCGFSPALFYCFGGGCWAKCPAYGLVIFILLFVKKSGQSVVALAQPFSISFVKSWVKNLAYKSIIFIKLKNKRRLWL